MPDATYDAVIIGGGHNGLVLGFICKKQEWMWLSWKGIKR